MRLALVLVLSLGCTEGRSRDEIGDPSPDASALLGRQKFNENVFPIINAKCSGRACHSAGSFTLDFVGISLAEAYDKITVSAVVGDFTNSAPLLLEVKDGTHKGMTYTAAEQAKIVDWLATERSERQ